jgi:hypothetical protein
VEQNQWTTNHPFFTSAEHFRRTWWACLGWLFILYSPFPAIASAMALWMK